MIDNTSESNSIAIAPMEEIMALAGESLASGRSVTIFPRGVSMLPMLREGLDSVELSPVTGKLKKYDIPLYRRADGSFVLHRIVKVGKTYTCSGDNQTAYENGVSHESVVAVVTAFTRGKKRYTVKNFGYRVYCRVLNFRRKSKRLYLKARRKICRLFKKN